MAVKMVWIWWMTFLVSHWETLNSNELQPNVERRFHNTIYFVVICNIWAEQTDIQWKTPFIYSVWPDFYTGTGSNGDLWPFTSHPLPRYLFNPCSPVLSQAALWLSGSAGARVGRGVSCGSAGSVPLCVLEFYYISLFMLMSQCGAFNYSVYSEHI